MARWGTQNGSAGGTDVSNAALA
ncbi:MAG: hypothetical protein JWN29_1371, partial [Acidimicrobiales bacterium]|nr:hypothetical protein [Acidimicrobiales bacterium]